MKNRLLNICILCMVFPFFLQAADTHSVYNLRCEQEENPLGIETGQPCFSWQIQAQQRNFEQSAWQILVADSPEKLQAGNGNIWDSGKTLSSASILVPFKGKELKAGQTYYWKVRSWDKEDSPSRWSCIHTFGMGLLSEKDWSNAKWIALEKDRKDEIVTIGLPQEAWKPLLNMLPVLRGSSEWLAQLESERFLLWLGLTQPLSFAKQK